MSRWRLSQIPRTHEIIIMLETVNLIRKSHWIKPCAKVADSTWLNLIDFVYFLDCTPPEKHTAYTYTQKYTHSYHWLWSKELKMQTRCFFKKLIFHHNRWSFCTRWWWIWRFFGWTINCCSNTNNEQQQLCKYSYKP